MNRKIVVLCLLVLLFSSSVCAASIIQLRRDTAANWTVANPTLAQGEPGIETDTLKLKYGDGVTAWNALAYYTTNGTGISDSTLDTNSSADLNWLATSHAFSVDQNFTSIGFSEFIYGDGSKLTGIAAASNIPDSTLDTNSVADLNWLATDHLFTGDNNFINVAMSGNSFLSSLFASTITATGDANFVDIGFSGFIFGNGSRLSGINYLLRSYTGVSPVVVDNDLNTISLNQYIPTELDIDNNAIAIDTNYQTTSDFNSQYLSIFDSNNVSRLSYSVIADHPYIPTELDIDNNAIAVDTNFMTFADFNNWYLSIFDSNNVSRLAFSVIANHPYIPTEADIDNNAIAIDTNYQTTADFNSQYLSIFDSNNTSRLTYNVLADLNEHFYGKIDVNANFVPYVGAVADVNIGSNSFRAFGDSNFSNVSISGNLFGASPLQIPSGVNVSLDSNFENLQADDAYLTNLIVSGDLNAASIQISGVSFQNGGVEVTGDSNFINSGFSGNTFLTNVNIAKDLNASAIRATGDTNLATLGISGQTFASNFVNLHADPTEPLHAATKAYVDIAVSGLEFDFFLTDEASDIGTYFDMLDFETGEAESTITSAALNAGLDQEIFNFATVDGKPEFSTLLSSVYDGHYHFSKTGGAAKTVFVYWQLINRSPGGDETVLFTSETSEEITIVAVSVDLHGVLPADVSIDGNRIVAKVFADVVGGGGTVQIVSHQEGVTASHITLRPPNTALDELYILRSGNNWMNGDLNLNGNNIIEVKDFNAVGDSNFGNILFDGLIFGDGSKLTGISGLLRTYTGISPVVVDSDANTIKLNKYIPTELDIDNNAIAVDTNYQTTADFNSQYLSIFDSNNPSRLLYSVIANPPSLVTLVLPWADVNVANDITVEFAGITDHPYIPTELDIDNNAIAVDTNFMTFADFNNWYLSIFDSNNTSRLDFDVIANHPYIPTELDIDNNAIAVDTNYQTTPDFNSQYLSIFDSNNVSRLLYSVIANPPSLVSLVLPWADVNVANDITLTNITQITNRSYSLLEDLADLNTVIDIRAQAIDTNFMTTVDFNNMYLSIFDSNNPSWLDYIVIANHPYIPTELDIDNNAIAVDTNANTACSGAGTYLNGEGACVDLNAMYVPYIGADYDLNMGSNDINTFGSIQIGAFVIDFNGTSLNFGVS